MTKNDSALKLLLCRLGWPSGVVRERACVELAHLLSHEDAREWIEERLLGWIASQALESLVCIGILPFCYAKGLGVSPPPVEKMAKSVQRPSILSWLLQRDLADGAIDQPNLSGITSVRLSLRAMQITPVLP